MTSSSLESAPVLAERDDGPKVARSPRQLAWRRFLSSKLAVVSSAILVLVALVAILAPLIATHNPNLVDLSATRQPPSAEHWFGTDTSGRDIFSRIVYGTQVSLAVGLAAALAAVLLGMLVGMVSGLLGGWVDALLMRIADVVLSFPTLLVVLAIVALTGPSVTMIILAIGLFEWPSAARIVRSVTLSARELDYVAAARNFGATTAHMVRHHVVPVVLSPLTVAATVLVARAIMLEATLSFLGLGAPPPTATWGGILNEAQNISVLQTMPWLWLSAGVAIAVVVMAVNFVGDGLRDAQDPRSRR